MTLLVGCVSCFLAVVLAAFTADISTTSATKTRAQAAADAAALAAVAESGPYGTSDPEAQAERLAELNGAELTECLCEVGASAMQVAVSVDGVVARARAVIDVEAIGPLGLTRGVTELHPILRNSLEELLEKAGGAVHVVSGWRSPEEQAALWAAALQRYGSAEAADDWVAPPGHSRHERGLAVDLGGDVELAARLVEELGLPMRRPLPNEPWHFELVGAR
ncbi:MAG: D-alanyl-D-alanine carboxypeptidase family protein [Actinomycetota bacterium]